MTVISQKCVTLIFYIVEGPKIYIEGKDVIDILSEYLAVYEVKQKATTRYKCIHMHSLYNLISIPMRIRHTHQIPVVLLHS